MRRNAKLLGSLLILGLAATGRGYCEEPAKAADTKAKPAVQAASAGKDATTAVKKAKEEQKPLVAGKVMETIDAGRYTYMRLEKDGRTGWVAVPAMKVEVGQEVKLNPGMEMGQFTSTILKRTFDQIVFTTAPATEQKAQAPQEAPQSMQTPAMPAGHVPVPAGHAAMPGMNGPAETAAPLTGKVVETMDGGGYTYICLEKDGKKTWVATPVMKVKVGEVMELQPGGSIPNFTSKSLKRTFESIIFSGGPVSRK